jgi:O-antigen ligase
MNTDFRGTAPGRYLLGWIIPALFALLVSATIRFHSLALVQTMPRIVGNLLAVAGVALLALMALGRRIVVPRDVVWLLLALGAAATVSVLGSGGADASLLRLELYLAMTLLAIAIYLTYRDAGILPVESFLLAIALVHLPFLLEAILWIRDLEGPPYWEFTYRLAGFSNVRQYAEFAFFAAVGATGLGLLSRRLVVPSFLLAFAAVFGVVFTGSRGAALSWLAFVLLACLFSRARLRAAVHGVLVMACAAGLVWYLDRPGLLQSPNLFARVAGAQQGAESLDSARVGVWLKSLDQILARPMFGSGPEGYWLSGCCDQRIMQAHNFVLQFLLEFGVVGCGIALFLLVRAARGLGGVPGTTKLVLATPANRVLACMLASFLAYSLIDQMLYHLVPLLLFALLAGLFSAGLAQARGANLQAAPPR